MTPKAYAERQAAVLSHYTAHSFQWAMLIAAAAIGYYKHGLRLALWPLLGAWTGGRITQRPPRKKA